MNQAKYKWYLDTFSSEPGSRLIISVESVMKEVFGDDWETKLNEMRDFMEVVPMGTRLFMLKS